MPLKIGARGFILLGENFDQPRWREAQVVGLQKEWVQVVVRASVTEVESHSLSSCKRRGLHFLPGRVQGHTAADGSPWRQFRSGSSCKEIGNRGSNPSWFRRRAQLCHSIRAGCKTGCPESSERFSTTARRREWFFLPKQQRNWFGSPGQAAKEVARWWYGRRRAIREVKEKSISQEQERQEVLIAGKESSAPIGRQGFDSQGDHADGREEFGPHARPACIASSSVPDQKGKEEPKTSTKHQFSELRFWFEQGNLLQQNQFAVLGEAERPCEGSGALPTVTSKDVQTSTTTCPKICQGNRKRVGCRRKRLQGDRLHPKNSIWETEEPSTLSSFAGSDIRVSPQGRVFEGCPSDSPLPAGDPSMRSGWRVGGSMASNPHSRSVRKTVVGRRPCKPAECHGLSEIHERACQNHGCLEEKGQRTWRRGGFGEAAEDWQRQRWQGKEEGRAFRAVKAVFPESDVQEHSSAKPEFSSEVLQDVYGSWGSFGRFLKLVYKSPEYRMNKVEPHSKNLGVGPSSPSHQIGKDVALFPSLLRIPDFAGKPRSARRRARGRGHQETWEWVKMLWTFFTFLEGGEPYRIADQRDLLSRSQRAAWTPLHARYAGLMHKEIHRFVRLKDHNPLSRGIQKLDTLIQIAKSSQYKGLDLSSAVNTAKSVKPDRMSLPEEAGVIDPKLFLKGEHLDVFCNMSELVPVKPPPDPTVKGCFKVDKDDVRAVYTRLLESGVAVLLPEELAVRDSKGNIITGGLFAVDHKSSSDRIILDRRPLNEIEKRLVWAKLPHGCLLTQLIVPKGYNIRGNGDDLSNYFYLLKHEESWLPRNAVGESIDGHGFEKFGGVAGKSLSYLFGSFLWGI